MTTLFSYDENGNISTDWIPDNGYNGGYTMTYEKDEKSLEVNKHNMKKIICTRNVIDLYKETMWNQNE